MHRRTIALLVLALLGTAGSASAPAQRVQTVAPAAVPDGGPLTESLGQADARPLQPSVTYAATRFPIALRVRPGEPRWAGIQLHSGRFEFLQLEHMRTGSVPLHGRGALTLESGTGPLPSVTATVAKLHATPLIDAGPITTARVAGHVGKAFDATITGVDPGNEGIAFVPFTLEHQPPCGFCTSTLKETLDYKFAGKGQLFRIIVIDVRGKTVVIYLESMYDDAPNRAHPPAQSFPTFVPYAERLLARMTFPA
jgi:hypothetical protein